MRIRTCQILNAVTLWALTAAMTSISPAVSMAQSPVKADTRFEAARSVIRQAMDEKQITSVSVAVAKDGKIVWEESFGWADREKMIRATPDTLYSLPSISKPFTATTLMRLLQQAKINLHNPPNHHLHA